MERLDHLAEKFKHKCNIQEGWTAGKDDYLMQDDLTGATLADVLVCLETLLTFMHSDFFCLRQKKI